ncbi:MAG: transcriptional regulator [Legionellales bacterium]|jgi:DNA-binding phage protein
MALTREFKKTIQERVQSDPKFANALLNEAVELFLNGDPETAKIILRDLVNATIGFDDLAEKIHKSDKSVHRMLSAKGNPTMTNLSAVFAAIQEVLKVHIQTSVVKYGAIH